MKIAKDKIVIVLVKTVHAKAQIAMSVKERNAKNMYVMKTLLKMNADAKGTNVNAKAGTVAVLVTCVCVRTKGIANVLTLQMDACVLKEQIVKMISLIKTQMWIAVDMTRLNTHNVRNQRSMNAGMEMLIGPNVRTGKANVRKTH